MELLNRLFYAVSLDNDLLEPGMDLRELHHSVEEARRSQAHMQEILRCTGLSEEQALPIWNIWSSSCRNYEHQGFLNGFHLGMTLSRELLAMDGPEDL